VVHEAGDVALVAGIDHSPVRNKTNYVLDDNKIAFKHALSQQTPPFRNKTNYVLNDLRVSLNNILTT
jgi:hypothetical protein